MQTSTGMATKQQSRGGNELKKILCEVEHDGFGNYFPRRYVEKCQATSDEELEERCIDIVAGFWFQMVTRW